MTRCAENRFHAAAELCCPGVDAASWVAHAHLGAYQEGMATPVGIGWHGHCFELVTQARCGVLRWDEPQRMKWCFLQRFMFFAGSFREFKMS